MDGDFRIGPWLVQPSLNSVSRDNGAPMRLEPKVTEVLVCLARHPGRVVSKEQLLETVWTGTFVTDDVLTRSISELRRVFDDDVRNSRVIQTIPKRGYRLLLKVTLVGAEGPACLLPAASPARGTPRLRRKPVLLLAVAGVALVATPLLLNLGGWRERIFGIDRDPIRSLAVLPLANLSGDPSQDYFSEGMTEALTTELGKISSLRVISHQSALQYKDTRKSTPQIARELNVDAVVEGSIIRSGGQVRISVQLIDGRTDRHLWAHSYRRELREILVLQDDVARAVADEIQVKPTPQERTLLASAQPVNAKAHEAYLKGRYFVNRWPEPESASCLESFHQAIEAQPSYADAHAGLATCYTVLPWTYSPRVVLQSAKAAAQEALRLDPNQDEAYAAMGAVNLFYEWDWTAAEQNLRRALELNPNRAYARAAYSDYFAFVGRSDDAIREAKRAVECDPVSVLINRNLAFVYQLSHRYSEYAAQSQAVLELAPESSLGRIDLAWAYALQGKRNDAVTQLGKGGFPIGNAIVLATLGENERALQELRKAGTDASPFALATVYGALGRPDQALRQLNRAYERRDAMMAQLKTHPALDPLRGDPRFQDLMGRMNFPPSRP